MILLALFAGVLAGLDNLQVCASLGLLPLSGRIRARLALAFSACEITAPMAGILIGQVALSMVGPSARIAGPAISVVCGAAVLFSACGRGAAFEADARPLFGLPFSLCLDNLALGFGISPLAHPLWVSPLIIGLMSAAMSCVGLYAAALLRPRLPSLVRANMGFVVGGLLCALGVKSMLAGII
jgi:putative Mn2+ efflux pump MntP